MRVEPCASGCRAFSSTMPHKSSAQDIIRRRQLRRQCHCRQQERQSLRPFSAASDAVESEMQSVFDEVVEGEPGIPVNARSSDAPPPAHPDSQQRSCGPGPWPPWQVASRRGWLASSAAVAAAALLGGSSAEAAAAAGASPAAATIAPELVPPRLGTLQRQVDRAWAALGRCCTNLDKYQVRGSPRTDMYTFTIACPACCQQRHVADGQRKRRNGRLLKLHPCSVHAITTQQDDDTVSWAPSWHRLIFQLAPHALTGMYLPQCFLCQALMALRDTDQDVFLTLVQQRTREVLPLLYTPTVAQVRLLGSRVHGHTGTLCRLICICVRLERVGRTQDPGKCTCTDAFACKQKSPGCCSMTCRHAQTGHACRAARPACISPSRTRWGGREN